MGTAEQQHRRRAKADVCFIACTYTDKCPRACDVILLFCGILVFVRPSCKPMYRVYITKQANNKTPLRPVLTRPLGDDSIGDNGGVMR